MANKKKQPPHPCDGCTKDTKECRKCENAAAKASSLAEAERLHREVKLDRLTEHLPYERTLYVNHAKLYFSRTAENMLIAGKILLAIKENEPYGEFMRICSDELGIGKDTACRFMNVALKAEKFPALDFSQFAKFGHVYALLEAPEEDLKELESKGIMAGKDFDDLNMMSVKQVKDLVRQLRADKEQVAKGIEKEMRAEKKALENEINRLSAFEPQEPAKQAVEIFKQVDDHLEAIDTLLRHFVKIPAEELEGSAIAKVEGIYKRIQDRIKLWHVNWNAQLTGQE